MATQTEALVASPPLHSGPIPKAVLYAQEQEVWSSSVLLTLLEKGYSADELERRTVDTYKGENYELAYLRINGAGAVPTLVVPMDRYLGPEIESRYKSVSDITKVLEFLDKSRTVISKTHTTSASPAPALGPATVDALSKSNIIINLVHSEPMDLEFLFLSATTPEELVQKSQGVQGAYLKARTAKLEKALNSTLDSGDLNDPLPALTARSRAGLTIKYTLHKTYLAVYEAAANPASSAVQEFLAKSRKVWEVDVKAALDLVEKTIKISHVAAGEESLHDNHSDASVHNRRGPAPRLAAPAQATTTVNGAVAAEVENKPAGLILGEQLCLADLHLFPWLARAVYLNGGDKTADGLKKLETKTGGTVGERVKGFWDAMLERESVQTIYKDGLH